VIVLLPLMCRRLRRCRYGIVALVVKASLPLLMCRRLAIVDDDGDGATGNNDNYDGDGATGYDNNDDDCNGATGDETDDDGNDTMGYDDGGRRR